MDHQLDESSDVSRIKSARSGIASGCKFAVSTPKAIIARR
jgi:hypothetical protein